MQNWTVVKATGSHADIWAAVGAADALKALRPVLVDCGDRFEIRLARPFVRRDLAGIEPGYSYLPKSGTRPRGIPAARLYRPKPATADATKGAVDPERRV